MPDPDEMRAWQQYEETGRRPDDVYIPTGEDDGDPDRHEIENLVREQYTENNRERREQYLLDENAALRALLEANGIEIPEES